MPTTTEKHVGSSRLKECAEETEALCLQVTDALYRVDSMATAAMMHDLSDDKLHPVVIRAFRELGAILGEIDNLSLTPKQYSELVARAEAIRQTGYNAAAEAANIDYARRDGEAIQKEIRPLIQSAHRHVDQLRALRQKIEDATSRK